jgi:hypothetical protein
MVSLYTESPGTASSSSFTVSSPPFTMSSESYAASSAAGAGPGTVPVTGTAVVGVKVGRGVKTDCGSVVS